MEPELPLATSWPHTALLQCMQHLMQATALRPAIPLEKKVAIALRKLASTDSYRVVGDQFGVKKSSVGVILMQVVRALNSILLYRVIRLGDQDATMAGFAALGFPNCGGAIDGTHIPIPAPNILGPCYLNRKGYSSMVLQALVDHRGQFLDVYTGWLGKADDARIFRSSGLYKKLKKGLYFSPREFAVGDVQMPLCIVGDEAYPLLPWLMKPYTGHLDPSREQFNTRLNRARNPVERAFGRLKARFRCLRTRLTVGQKSMAELIAACCVLHNIVEKKGEAFLPAWEADTSQVGRVFEQPQTVAIRQAHQDGVRIREALREQFSQAPQ
nr:protein ALP1-like [Pelodiscus sinensis]|eukprot:XP_025038542.1 protein ALP1-like [Pelodiscus sinensis]